VPESNTIKEIFHFRKWILITAGVLLVLLGWELMYMMSDGFTKTLYVVIALGLIVPMALFAVQIDEKGISTIWEFKGKTFRLIKFVAWSEIVRVEVTEKFFYKGLKNIYVIPYSEKKSIWREYENAVGFNILLEDFRELAGVIMFKVSSDVDKSSLEDLMKSLEQKPKA
jgi:hypothetical protein